MDGLLEQLNVLDFVLAVFGAIIVAMWFGRGKSWKGILMGAVMGGFMKPTLFAVLGFVGMATMMDGGVDNTESDQATDEVLKILGK